MSDNSGMLETKGDLRALRDKFAMSIVNGYLSNHKAEFRNNESLVTRAYKIADIMMEERNK